MTWVFDVRFKAARRLHILYVKLNELHTLYQIMFQLGHALRYTVYVLVCPSVRPSHFHTPPAFIQLEEASNDLNKLI
jgi:hypothetical protein